jgi:hypothetical protein
VNRGGSATRVGKNHHGLALERCRLHCLERARPPLHDELDDGHIFGVGNGRLELGTQRDLGAPRSAALLAVVDEDEVRVVRVERCTRTTRWRR